MNEDGSSGFLPSPVQPVVEVQTDLAVSEPARMVGSS